MGRRAHRQTLHLWANGDYVGRWTVKASGESELQYDAASCRSKRGRPISLSLPFNLHNDPLKGDRVSRYFDGLLPDSDTIRKRVAVRFKTGSTDAFDLLAAIGRDCVGALQLLPEGVEPEGLRPVDGIVVDEEAIERHLLDVVNPGHYGAMQDADDAFRIALAGAQEKDAFLWWDGKWLKPRCVFRAKLDTHSTANWTPGPAQTGHAFHGKLDTQSSANWTLIPLQTGQFEAA